MKKIFIFGIVIIFAFFSFSSCAKKPSLPKAGTAAAEDMLTLIPMQAKGVFIVNFRRAMETEAAKKAIKEEENYKKYLEFTKTTGIDAQKDIYYIAGAMTGEAGPTQQEGVVLLNLKYNKDLVLTAIKKQETAIEEEDYKGITIYSGGEGATKRRGSGAFLDDSNITLGNKEAVKAVIDVYQGKAESILKSEELSALIKNANKDALLWGTLIFPPELTKQLADQNPMLKSLEGIRSLLIYFDYKNKSLIAEIKALSSDAAKNQQLATLLNGLKAGGAMASAKEQDFADLMNKIEITSGPDHIRIYANIPEDLLSKLGEKMKKGKKVEDR